MPAASFHEKLIGAVGEQEDRHVPWRTAGFLMCYIEGIPGYTRAAMEARLEAHEIDDFRELVDRLDTFAPGQPDGSKLKQYVTVFAWHALATTADTDRHSATPIIPDVESLKAFMLAVDPTG